MALVQIKHWPQLKGLVRGATSARRPAPRRVLRIPYGLNRDATIAALAGGYDANGNLANEGVGGRTFGYDIDNHLISTTGAVSPLSLSYDPMGRLSGYTAGSVTTQFLYDGTNLIGEYVGGAMTQRYAHGLGTDQPLAAFSGAGVGTGALKYLYTDRQGSVIALADSGGTVTQKYAYGPWGEPNSWTGSRFMYTGQTVIPEAWLYYYKARIYDPNYGRFLQTDPIGSDDDINLYAYVGGDPVNGSDPLGLFKNCGEFKEAGGGACTDITETRERTVEKDGKKLKESYQEIVGLRLEELPTRDLANEHYKSNDGLYMEVPVSSVLKNSEVNWAELEKNGKYFISWGKIPDIFDSNNRRAQVLGSVTIEKSKDGSAEIANDTYNFEMHKATSGKETVRNILTVIGTPGKGTPFEIRFSGSVKKTSRKHR